MIDWITITISALIAIIASIITPLFVHNLISNKIKKEIIETKKINYLLNIYENIKKEKENYLSLFVFAQYKETLKKIQKINSEKIWDHPIFPQPYLDNILIGKKDWEYVMINWISRREFLISKIKERVKIGKKEEIENAIRDYLEFLTEKENYIQEKLLKIHLK